MKNKTLYVAGFQKRFFLEDIIAFVIILFSAYTLISSITELSNLKGMLGFYTVDTTTIAWIIIVIEAITLTLLFFPITRTAGFISFILLAVFAGITMLRYPHNPHDFGGIFNHISRPQKWMVIVTVSLISAGGILLRLFNTSNTHLRSGDQRTVYN